MYPSRRHVRHRRRSSVRDSADAAGVAKGTRRTRQLAACCAILIIAAVLKVTYPSALDKVNGYITKQVDFTAAFRSIGEGISGDIPMSEAISEAYRIAFLGGTSDDILYAGGGISTPEIK